MSKIIIFGAGNCGRLIAMQRLKDTQDEIICMLDNDKEKQNTTIEFMGGGAKFIFRYYPQKKFPH